MSENSTDNTNHEPNIDNEIIEKIIFDRLTKIVAELHKSDDAKILLEKFLNVLEMYFEKNISENPSDFDEKIFDLYRIISNSLILNISGNKLGTVNENMAVGQFIDGLICLGLPRLPAIIATANWLNWGITTVRTANEKYRKKHGKIKSDPEITIHLSPYKETMKALIKENPNFPTKHPHANKAFKKIKAVYLEGLNEYISQVRKN